MMPGRDTGHYGTGTYFFGSKDTDGFAGYAEKGRPIHSVSFDGYNLFKPKSKQDGEELHSFLKNLNDVSLSDDTADYIDFVLDGKMSDSVIEEIVQTKYPKTPDMDFIDSVDNIDIDGLDGMDLTP